MWKLQQTDWRGGWHLKTAPHTSSVVSLPPPAPAPAPAPPPSPSFAMLCQLVQVEEFVEIVVNRKIPNFSLKSTTTEGAVA
jgi:hypothetical protein